jgi:hypothetical protein
MRGGRGDRDTLLIGGRGGGFHGFRRNVPARHGACRGNKAPRADWTRDSSSGTVVKGTTVTGVRA